MVNALTTSCDSCQFIPFCFFVKPHVAGKTKETGTTQNCVKLNEINPNHPPSCGQLIKAESLENTFFPSLSYLESISWIKPNSSGPTFSQFLKHCHHHAFPGAAQTSKIA